MHLSTPKGQVQAQGAVEAKADDADAKGMGIASDWVFVLLPSTGSGNG